MLVEGGAILGARRADPKLRRDVAALWHADLVGAGEIIEPRGDREHGALSDASRHAHIDEDRVIALEHIVHQARDQ